MRPHYRSRLSVLNIDDLEHLIDVNHKVDANDPSFYKLIQYGRHEDNNLEADQTSDDYSVTDIELLFWIQSKGQKGIHRHPTLIEKLHKLLKAFQFVGTAENQVILGESVLLPKQCFVMLVAIWEKQHGRVSVTILVSDKAILKSM